MKTFDFDGLIHENAYGDEVVMLMNDTSILGQELPMEMLKRAKKTGRVAHAYLFHGPKGVGKEKTAFWFAKLLNCPDMGDCYEPCGECDSCQKIARLSHPDVRLLATELTLVSRGIVQQNKKQKPSDQIRATQLDDLAGLFRHRPYAGVWKVVVVIESDRMNHHCQNRFLKTLEEPSKDTVIMLVTAHPESLLPTVLSRCQSLSFGPLRKQRIADYLIQERKVPRWHAHILAAMAQGSVDRAVELSQGNVLDARDRVVEALDLVRQGDLADLLEQADDLGQSRQSVESYLDLMEVWFRDILFINTNTDTDLVVNQDRLEWVHDHAGYYTAMHLLSLIERIRSTRKNLKVYANPKMVIESVLLATRLS